MSTRDDRITARVSTEAALILRGLSATLKKSVSQYVRDALASAVDQDLELLAKAMRMKGYGKARTSREIRKILVGETAS